MLTTNNQKPHPIKLGGGLDTSTAPMSVPEGCLIGSQNYQERVVDGGYERVAGYERFDGRPWPSNAEITALLGSPAWTAGAAVGSIATGGISGASGVICYYSTTLLGLTKRTGLFVPGEQLLVGGTPVGQIGNSPSVDPLTFNAISAGAEGIYRADIAQVPGSGPVRGVCVLENEVYAFRDNAGATAQEVWKASATGWVAVPTFFTMKFTAGGLTEPVDVGLVIAKTSVSGGLVVGVVRAVVRRIMTESGDWLAGTAAGTLVVEATTGGTFATPSATLTLTDAAGHDAGSADITANTASLTAITLRPGGRWKFVPYQFALLPYAHDLIYGCDLDDTGGGGNFIEFDGVTVAPLTAGGLPAPSEIEIHKNHLFGVFDDTTVQFSSLGNPYVWSVLSGAGQMVTGAQCTVLKSVAGSEAQAAMLSMCLDMTYVLYGESSANFKLTPLSKEVGAKRYSAQVIGEPIAFDAQGVRSFMPTSNFGNFTFNTLSNHVRKNVVNKTPTASALDSDGGRYRCYFSDGTWITGTPKKPRWSWLLCKYPFTVHFAQHWELDGASRIFATGQDGWVYMLDRGRSFDGADIEAWFKTAYASFGTPWQTKTFKRFEVEIRGQSAGELQAQTDYSYGDTAMSANAIQSATNNPIPPPASPWDLGTWDTGTWDSQYSTMLSIRSGGRGENVAATFYTKSASELPHHMTTLVHYSIERKQKRG